MPNTLSAVDIFAPSSHMNRRRFIVNACQSQGPRLPHSTPSIAAPPRSEGRKWSSQPAVPSIHSQVGVFIEPFGENRARDQCHSRGVCDGEIRGRKRWSPERNRVISLVVKPDGVLGSDWNDWLG